MRIDATSRPSADPQQPPTRMDVPGRSGGGQLPPSFPVEEGVIFQPLMHRDDHHHPTFKGMFRWELQR